MHSFWSLSHHIMRSQCNAKIFPKIQIYMIYKLIFKWTCHSIAQYTLNSKQNAHSCTHFDNRPAYGWKCHSVMCNFVKYVCCATHDSQANVATCHWTCFCGRIYGDTSAFFCLTFWNLQSLVWISVAITMTYAVPSVCTTDQVGKVWSIIPLSHPAKPLKSAVLPGSRRSDHLWIPSRGVHDSIFCMIGKSNTSWESLWRMLEFDPAQDWFCWLVHQWNILCFQRSQLKVAKIHYSWITIQKLVLGDDNLCLNER